MLKRNHSYFDVIDSEYKAYILGFIYADGTIYRSKAKNRQLRLTIAIQEEDGYVLERLGKDIEGIKVRTSYPPSVKKMGWKARKIMSFSSDLLCNKLIEYGCFINKSQIGMNFPTQVPKELIHHFIRGFFDGDGSVTIHKDKYKGKIKDSVYLRNRIAFCSTSKEFLESLVSILPVKNIYRSGKKRTMFVHNYWIERKEDIKSMFEFLYKDANYFLKRKYDKFLMSIKSQALGTPNEGLETTWAVQTA